MNYLWHFYIECPKRMLGLANKMGIKDLDQIAKFQANLLIKACLNEQSEGDETNLPNIPAYWTAPSYYRRGKKTPNSQCAFKRYS